MATIEDAVRETLGDIYECGRMNFRIGGIHEVRLSEDGETVSAHGKMCLEIIKDAFTGHKIYGSVESDNWLRIAVPSGVEFKHRALLDLCESVSCEGMQIPEVDESLVALDGTDEELSSRVNRLANVLHGSTGKRKRDDDAPQGHDFPVPRDVALEILKWARLKNTDAKIRRYVLKVDCVRRLRELASLIEKDL